jgi:hypothetical protein
MGEMKRKDVHRAMCLIFVSLTVAGAGAQDSWTSQGKKPCAQILCLAASASATSLPDAPGQSAGGQPAPKQPADTGGLHIEWVPAYLWFTGMSGDVGARGLVVPVDAGFSEVFDKLNFGYMTALDVRKGRFGLLTDLLYSKLSDDKTLAAAGPFSAAHAESTTFFLDPELYGRVLSGERGFVDMTAGIRYWHLHNSIDLDAGLLPALSVAESQDWVDPVVGARFRANLAKGWFASLKGDAGGFGAGSELSWQIFAGVGKEIKQKYSLVLAYRRLDVDYHNGGFLFDTSMHGLLLGLGIKFK